jgi:hypothetical protein
MAASPKRRRRIPLSPAARSTSPPSAGADVTVVAFPVGVVCVPPNFGGTLA